MVLLEINSSEPSSIPDIFFKTDRAITPELVVGLAIEQTIPTPLELSDEEVAVFLRVLDEVMEKRNP